MAGGREQWRKDESACVKERAPVAVCQLTLRQRVELVSSLSVHRDRCLHLPTLRLGAALVRYRLRRRCLALRCCPLLHLHLRRF
jgi:hypothetical protein